MCTVIGDTEMAKSKNSKTKKLHAPRDNSPIASRRLREHMPSPSVTISRTLPEIKARVREPLQQVEDRRTFHPDGKNRPALTKTGRPATVIAANRPRPKAKSKAQVNRFGPTVHSQTKGVITFEAPKETVVCIRRHRRKEVLFAKKRTGKGGRRNRNPVRTWLSKISCRR